MISFPLLTAVFNVVGIFGGFAVGVGLMGAPAGSYFNGISRYLSLHDIRTGFYKALLFGLVVTWVCCYKGYYAARMATGISRATTEAVVLSSVLILVWDYFLGSVLL
jgi:phospholipid/cholesterol/gamma-HCH transport system permease protein